jgi:hypothetical protein
MFAKKIYAATKEKLSKRESDKQVHRFSAREIA